MSDVIHAFESYARPNGDGTVSIILSSLYGRDSREVLRISAYGAEALASSLFEASGESYFDSNEV